jgi:hypothetical protein
MAFSDDIDVPLLTSLSAAGIMLLLVVVIGTQGFFYYYENQLLAKRIIDGRERPTEEIASAIKSQTEISSPGRFAFIDSEKTIVRLPINQAMQTLVHNKGKVPSTQPAK